MKKIELNKKLNFGCRGGNGGCKDMESTFYSLEKKIETKSFQRINNGNKNAMFQTRI